MGCCELDDVGNEEVARDYEVEGCAEEDVLSSVVVAADADEDSILLWLAVDLKLVCEQRTFLKFSIINRRLPTTICRSQTEPREYARGRQTQYNDHQIPEAQKTGRSVGIMTQTRSPRLRMHSSNMPVLLLQSYTGANRFKRF